MAYHPPVATSRRAAQLGETALDRSVALYSWSRLFLALAGIAYVFTGLSFFVLPEYAAGNFPWNVSPFVAMTIGGWTLGIGLMALESFRARSIAGTYPALLAVWSFSLLQLVVLAAFAGVARGDHLLTWPYLLALALGSVSGLAGLPAVWRRRAELAAAGDGVPRWIRAVYRAFVVLVGLLAVGALLIGGSDAGVFPEPLGAFTMRAFAAFFAALTIGALPLAFARDAEPAVQYARAGLYPVALITAAAISFVDLFDFGARPGGLIYFGAYGVTAAVAAAIVVWYRGQIGRAGWR